MSIIALQDGADIFPADEFGAADRTIVSRTVDAGFLTGENFIFCAAPLLRGRIISIADGMDIIGGTVVSGGDLLAVMLAVKAKTDNLPITVNVLSATQGAIQVSYAKSGGAVEIVKGDSISIPYGPLNKNIAGRRLYFGAKENYDDTTYIIAVKEITGQISDFVNFKGSIPLTAAESNIESKSYYAEMESRDSDGTGNPATEMKFILKVAKAVIW